MFREGKDMPSLIFSRRQVAKACLLLLPGQAFASNTSRFFDLQTADDLVFSILKKSYQLQEEQRSLVPAYLTRLRTPGLHTQKPEVFHEWLNNSKIFHDQLNSYVVEEFVVASNYFAVQAGQDRQLRILTSLDADPALV